MKIAIEELKKIANDLKLEIDESEYTKLQQDFDDFLAMMELLNKVNIEGYTPLTFPLIYPSAGLREDVVEDVMSQEEVLMNAKDVFDGQIKINKVVR